MLKSPLFWKITTLIGCIVLLSLPLMMVRELINERADYRSEVVDAIEQSTSGSQKLAGPLRKFVLDFQGGDMDRLPKTANVEVVVVASRGEIRDAAVHRLQESELWRCHFDLSASGSEPVDLRCFLRDATGALSETWLYQWSPPPVGRG